MKKFAICYNQEISHSVEVKDKLNKILSAKGINAEVLNIDNLKDGFDFVFVIEKMVAHLYLDLLCLMTN